MTKVKDLTGEVFERWKVLERAGSDKRGGALWLCKCKCGTVKKVMRGNLVNNISKSCGCLHNEQLAKTSYKHGLSTHPLYYIWWHMVDRCNNHKNKAYQDYGGRGIQVCNSWLDMNNFIHDMFGSYQDNLTIERVNNDKNYTLENCKWATRKEQINNRRNTMRFTVGETTLSLADWSTKTGIHYDCLYSRLRRGWPIERAVEQ